MVRTTVYLPVELKAALTREARASGRSEAELIRLGIRTVVTAQQPKIPLFRSGNATLAERVDDALQGFGED